MDPSSERTRPRPAVARRVAAAVATLLTLALFTLAVLVTGFVACGVSGCSGSGFGPAYAPTQAQVGLLVGGLTLVPLAVWSLRRHGRLVRTGAGAAAVVLGAVSAMLLLGLGPDGCPQGQERATAGPEAFDPGSATCSGDRDAVR